MSSEGMTITIFGATGMVGKKAVAQSLANNSIVKAFGRNVDDMLDKDLRNEHFSAIKGYVFDEDDVYNALKGSDAVISVLGGAIDGTDKSRSLGIRNIIQQMEKAGVNRIVALGGMGVLNADEDHYILDTPGFPQQYKIVGQEHLLAYIYLQSSPLEWTFVCPPNILAEEGSRNYITNADYVPEPNVNEIAAGDLADFMLKEIEAKQYLRRRVGISRV